MNEINEHIESFEKLKGYENQIDDICDLIIKKIKEGSNIFVAGNGGSASDSQHLTSELVWRFEKDRKAISAYDLTSNISTITAIANDSNYNYVFSRQIEALAKKNDIFIAISTSGNSQSILNAVKTCNQMGITTFGLTGNSKNNKLVELSEYHLQVPSIKTSRIQEMHLFIYHYLCKKIDQSIL